MGEGRRRPDDRVAAPFVMEGPGAVEVRPHVGRVARTTPLVEAPDLGARLGATVRLKLESLQETGSFKVRGAAARLGALSEKERRDGVVACSSGNHGRAVAFVAGQWGIPASIYVPSWVDPVKLEGIRAAGAEAVLAGDTFDEAEARALAEARASGRAYVSAYDDPFVIAGQGTVALEVVEQLAGLAPDMIMVPLSGGGLVGGIGRALREAGHETEVVAVSAERAAVMLASVRAGRPVELPEEDTLATALAGGIGLDNRHSFALVRDVVDRHVVVSEGDIRRAMRYAVERLRLVVEGGGAVALAALLSGAVSVDGGRSVVAVVSGGNVAPDTLAGVLAGGEGGAPR